MVAKYVVRAAFKIPHQRNLVISRACFTFKDKIGNMADYMDSKNIPWNLVRFLSISYMHNTNIT